jgi:hypothetical protein
MTKPLSHISVQVATPSGDGRFTQHYVTSLINTQHTLEHFGAQFNWAVFPGSSDLCHARNKILGEFVRAEKYTHLLKVDDDMGWEPADVVRMLASGKDFISGVGCKKKYPLEWCCSNRSDDAGIQQPVTFHQEGDIMLAEINYVGAGFVLISRECATRMIAAYQELMYVDCYDAQKEVGLYDPVTIINGDYRERYFDDFAFCYRWRKIGGKVFAIPDIQLKHTGNHTFEGKWESSFSYGEEKEQNQPGEAF